MWHYKTKQGTFWIVESDADHEYYLGMDEESLGHYKRLEDAFHDIRCQETGNIKWDMVKQPDVPDNITEWMEGEPENWEEGMH